MGQGTGLDLGTDLEGLIATLFSDRVPRPDQTDAILCGARITHAVDRWFLQTGRIPEPADWAENDDWPDPAEARERYGSWAGMIAESSLAQSPLVGPLKELGPSIAKLREKHAQAVRHRRAVEQELDKRERDLDRRERTMRGELKAEMERASTALGEDLNASRDAAQAEVQQACRDAASERQRAEKAERQVAQERGQVETLRQLCSEAEEETRTTRLRASALVGALADATQGARPAFHSWMELPGGHFDGLVLAAGGGLADGEFHEEIGAASPGSTDLPWREGVVSVRRSEVSGARIIEIVQSEPLDGQPTALRRTSVSVWEAHGRAGLLMQVSFLNADPALDAALLRAISERVMQLAAPLPDARWPVGTRATVVDALGFEEFMTFLRDPDRERPVLVLTSERGGSGAPNPERLAAQLWGAAHVVRLERAPTSRMTQVFGTELGVRGGDVRCYRPGFSEQSPSWQHPRLTREHLSERASDELHQELVLLASAPTKPPESFVRARELAGFNAEREPGADDHGHLANRVRALELENAALRRELENQPRAREETPDDRGAAPRTVLEATIRAEAEAQHLRFAPRSRKTAAECPFRRAQEIYEKLMMLDRLAGEYCAGEMGTGVGERALALGLNWRSGISETARRRFPHEYSCSYSGHTLALGPHVVVGNASSAELCARIYLHACEGTSDLERGLIVGHIGRHLPDASNG